MQKYIYQNLMVCLMALLFSASALAQTTITVLTPNGGETIAAGTSFNITWTAGNPPANARYRVELLAGGQLYRTIAADTNALAVNWAFPTDLANRNDYRIRVSLVGAANTSALSNANFTISGGRFISVVQPVAGTTVPRNAAYPIIWNDNIPENVRIELLQNGTVAQTIATSAPSNGNFSWTPPNTLDEGRFYQMRITSISDPFVTVTTLGTFSIGRFVLILTPNGGEVLDKGVAYNITWGQNFNENVRIELFKGGTFNQVISTSTPGSSTILNSFSWTPPASIADGTDYRIRIAGATSTTISDESDQNFTIGEFLRLTTPVANATVLKGTTFNINWQGNVTGDVRIELLRGTTVELVIAATAPGAAGTFAWAVPEGLADANNYTIRVRSVSNASIVATSPLFSISAPLLEVIAPNGGESLNRQRPYTITWNSNIGGNVRIELLRNNVFVQNVVSTTANNGSFIWDVPLALTNANDYRIRIISLSIATAVANSANNFSIIAPASIALTAPNGGENWQRNRNYAITWSSNFAENVRIELLRNNVVQSTISPGTPSGTGSFNWLVPVNTPLGNDYRIRVSSTQFANINAQSAANFSIAERDTLRILSPNGGESFVRGVNNMIRWQTNVTEPLILELLQNDNLVATISTTAQGGEFSWIIPPDAGSGTNNYRVRFRTTDNRLVVQSQNVFSIVEPIFVINQPSTNATWLQGFSYPVTWFSNFPGGVRIELLKGTEVVSVISDNAPQSPFNWAIPLNQPTGDDYRVRITSLQETNRIAFSNFFNIATPNITVTSPNGGEVWLSNNFRYNITWTDNTSAPVRIALFRDGVEERIISESTTGGTFNWTLPADLPQSTAYRIRISSTLRSSVFDESNANFTINTPVINVTSPQNGDILFRTLTYTISWNSNLGNQLMRIELINSSGQLIREIASSVENGGTFPSFNITTVFPLGNNFRVRVSPLSNPAVSGVSTGTFSIAVDNIPPVLSNFSFPSTLDFDQSTEAIAPTVAATDNVGIARVQCFFRGITADRSTWLARDAFLENNLYRVFISGNEFDAQGVEYYFEATDRAGNTAETTVARTYRRFSGNRGLAMPDIIFGSQQQDYQIISVPVNLDNASASQFFERYFGPYNRKNWRLFRYMDGSNKELGNGFTDIEPGKGYWLISNTVNEDVLGTGSGTVVQANADNPFVWNLSPGWNQIGNPYNINLSWNEIRQANPGVSLGALRIFETEFQSSDLLRRFRGGFVFSDASANINVPIIRNRSINGGRVEDQTEEPALKNPIHQREWEVMFNLKTGESSYPFGGFGMRNDASELKDSYDDMTLPRFQQYQEINFMRPEYFYPKFTKDIVPAQDQFTWNFTVESNLNQALSTLSWDNTYFGEARELILLDRELQRVVDMRKTNTYSFRRSANGHRFSIFYGDEAYINTQLQADKLALMAYPNPFQEKINIEFALTPEQDQALVSVQVYNMSGQQVASLLQNERLGAGFHQVVWNRSDRSGTPMPSGAYLCRMQVVQADGKVHSITRTLIAQ